MTRRIHWLGALTALFIFALMFAVFSRSMAHPSINTDLVAFISRANAAFWKMVALEAAVYVVACTLVIWRVRKP